MEAMKGASAARSDAEILERVLAIAEGDGGVRAVVRTDLLPAREYLRSFNFIFIVDDIDRYGGDVFRDRLGERLLLFRADRSYPELFPGARAHLMVFGDGATIVIQAMDRDAFMDRYGGAQPHGDVWIGQTFQKLLDRDGLLPDIDRLEETQTLFDETPSREAFEDACDEFWWVMKTFAEYTLREELPAAMYYLNVSVRGLLNRLLRWHIRLEAGGPVDMGILDANLERLLEKDLFRLYRATWPDAEYPHIWQAFDAAARLWREAGSRVAERRGFPYPRKTEEDMLAFIRRLRQEKADRPQAGAPDNPKWR